MSSKSFILKIIISYIIFLKISCIYNNYTQKNHTNITKKNSTIYLNYTSYFINSTIRTLSSRNFDQIISLNNNTSIDFLILFTLRRCPNCNQIIKITENIEKKYSEKNKPLKFYKLDSYLNHWIAMRFDIHKVPIYIYISKGNYASFIPEKMTEDELINFIENKNKEYMKYPEKIGYFDVAKKVVHNITLNIQKKIIFWNDFFTWLGLIGTFLGFLYFEFKIYKAGCCGNNNNRGQINKNKKEEIKQKNKLNNENNKIKNHKMHKHNYEKEKEEEENDFEKNEQIRKNKFRKSKQKFKEE